MSKELFHNKWVSVFETEDGYTFSSETRCSGETVAVLVVDSVNKIEEVLGRFELCPAHSNQVDLYSLTGGVEQGRPLTTAIHELEEEAGYKASHNELVYLGKVRPSKSADTVTHLYFYDTKGQAPHTSPKGDGSHLESIAYTKWVNIDEAIILSPDPVLTTLITRYKVWVKSNGKV